MVSACPTESDPRVNVNVFITDDKVRNIAGLRVEGLKSLMDVVKDALVKNYPDSNIILLSRDIIAENDICFSRDLESYVISKLDADRGNNILIYDDLAMNGWQNAFSSVKGSYDAQVFFGSTACHQVPLCSKLL